MFTHLHVHTEYSLLDGMCRISQLVARAKELGMESLAITDHGAMYGVIEFYQAAREAGIKPIIGCEVYISPGSRFDRNANDRNNHHLILLAKNHAGYLNLVQLTTKAHLEGFYYKPRIDKELLVQHKEGLIGLSACLAGEISNLLLSGRHEDAKKAALWYRENLENFYLEIMRHPIAENEEANRHLIKLGQELDIPLVATNDTHYIKKEDASAHDLLLCIGTNTTIHDEKRLKMDGDFYYLKSPQEMADNYKDIPQALENTLEIADMCNLDLEFGRLHLPEIELPTGKTADEYLADLCHENFRKYYPEPTPEIEERLEYELEVIRTTEFANYILVVWDIISFARKENIYYGVRGSAASSIVLYLLGVTYLDPIEYGLVFERFLNIERREMPDIDLDIQDDRRDEVINYISRTYGQDHVAQIITFGTLGARAAIRDVGRALGMPYGNVDRVARLVPGLPGMTLGKAMDDNPELKSIYQEDEIVRTLVNQARRVEGVSRHASTHAAGVVISKEPLTNHVPLQRGGKIDSQEAVMTQFAMNEIALIGLLKMDFLGLANLTILGKARETIKESRGIDIDLHNIPLDDKKTFELIASGETTGIFQLEGSGMRKTGVSLKPTTFGDIAAIVALFRPGPMEHIPRYTRAKHGEEKIRYPHPALEDILKDTYGVIVYQEQVLFIVQAIAGYSLGRADVFRKAMGKKIAETMRKEKKNFMDGAIKNGFSEKDAEQIFALIEPFSGYAFNKAHAFSYALIAYQTAYLKANYPAEYITAFLTIQAGETDKVANAIAECRRINISVLPPDINRSHVEFSIENDDEGKAAIRFGLSAIKNVGIGAVEPVIIERAENGEFKSIEDFCRRCDLRTVNKRVMESLIKVGTLDDLGNRGSLLESVDRIISLAQKEQRLKETGQSTMFDLWGDSAPVPLPDIEMTPMDITDREKALWEKELMGITFSEKPFNPILPNNNNAVLCGNIDIEMDKQVIITAGRVASARYSFTKKGEAFAIFILEDISGNVEVIAWPQTYNEYEEYFLEGNELVVQGKVRVRDNEITVICDSASYYEHPGEGTETGSAKLVAPRGKPVDITTPASPPVIRHRLTINLKQTSDKNGDIELLNKVVDILKSYPGSDEVRLNIVNGGDAIPLRLPNVRTVYSPELEKRLGEVVEEGSYRVETIA